MSKLNCETLKYFMECYFHLGTNYEELENIVTTFKSAESQNSIRNLVDEINSIRASDNWSLFQKIVKKHGQRRLNSQKLKNMIEIIVRNLSNDV